MQPKEEWESLNEAVRSEAQALDGVVADCLSARAAAGKRIYCAAGCSNCCTLYVQSTLVEALIVAEQLDAGQFRQLEEYIERQREIFAGESDLLAVLRKQRAALGPCPFLNDAGECGIYALRPLACRALLSTKDPAWCGVDFTTLDPLEKRLYLESLESAVVAFPVHYVASTQQAAQSAEARILAQMSSRVGSAISGNFPLLVYLAYRNDLATQIEEGVANWQTQLPASPFFHPLLLHIQPVTEIPLTLQQS